MIKERKQVDPDTERERRNQAAIKRMMTGLRSFNSEMECLKLIDADILEDAQGLLKKIEEKYL